MVRTGIRPIRHRHLYAQRPGTQPPYEAAARLHTGRNFPRCTVISTECAKIRKGIFRMTAQTRLSHADLIFGPDACGKADPSLTYPPSSRHEGAWKASHSLSGPLRRTSARRPDRPPCATPRTSVPGRGHGTPSPSRLRGTVRPGCASRIRVAGVTGSALPTGSPALRPASGAERFGPGDRPPEAEAGTRRLWMTPRDLRKTAGKAETPLDWRHGCSLESTGTLTASRTGTTMTGRTEPCRGERLRRQPFR